MMLKALIQSSLGQLSLAALVIGAAGMANAETTVCTHDDNTREIEVVYEMSDAAVPCSVVYRKDGNEQTLWSAQAEEGFCEAKASEFVAKQESWGWSCSVAVEEESTEG